MTSTTQRANHERHCENAEEYIQFGAYENALGELEHARKALHEAGGTARCEYLVALCLHELGHDASGPLQESQRLFFQSSKDIDPDPTKEASVATLLENIRTLQARVILRDAESLLAEMRDTNGDTSLASEASIKVDDALKSDRLGEAERAFAVGLKAYCQWRTQSDVTGNEQQALFTAKRVLKRLGEVDLELVIIDLLLDTSLTRLQAFWLAMRELCLNRWADGATTGLRALAGFHSR